MKYLFLILLILFSYHLIKGQDMLNPDKISHRPPKVSGLFYPENPDTLKKKLNEYINYSENNISYKEYDIIGLVAPHAGYTYSGGVAGTAYVELIGRNYDIIIVISPSHTKYFNGSCIFNGDAYLTPLGPAWVDREFSEKIASNNKNVYLGIDGHEWNSGRSEHALEVQIPFIQIVQPNAKIIPIVMGSQDSKSINDLMQSLYYAIKSSDKKILMVASSDLSHFHNSDQAEGLDEKFIKCYENYDYFKIQNLISTGEIEACGAGPIQAVMMTAEALGYNITACLDNITSADSPETPTDKNRVVGYFSGLIYKDSTTDDFILYLTSEEKQNIISYTKEVIKNKILMKDESPLFDYNLDYDYGLFVTIKKNGELRSCMGHLISSTDFETELKNTAEMTCTKDYRFGPINANELDQISVEVTVLSRFKRILDINSIEIGKHGLYIRHYDKNNKISNSGLLLPQVATENNMTKTNFLESLCRKAGLSKDSYLDLNSELFIFEAEIISENENFK